MSSDTLFRDRVRERDLDNFLVEELHASAAFREWLIEKLRGCFQPPEGLQLRVQKSPPRLQDNRQTDVRLGWFDGATLKACVLLESKVTADFQPGQAQSYARELAEHRSQLGNSRAAAVLVAPRARLVSLVHHGAFDAVVSIEDLSAFLASRLEDDELGEELAARLLARIDLLEALSGKRAVAAWTPVTIAAKRDFAEAYREVALRLLPNWPVRPSTDGPKAITRIFEVTHLAPELPRATLRHEFGNGRDWKYANLQFPGLADRVHALKATGLFNGTGFEVTNAGKSLAIRVATPAIDPTQPFHTQECAVKNGLTAIANLVAFVEAHAALIAKALRS
jgi:hypothetical protein